MTSYSNILLRWFFVGLGALFSMLKPTVPFALICIFAAFLDCISAWRLARRIKRLHPEIPEDLIHDKFESDKLWNMFPKLALLYGVIILCHFIDQYIYPFLDLYLPNAIAGAFCFRELWSILENESSENPNSWAKLAQKVMVNKAARHIEDLGHAMRDFGKKAGKGHGHDNDADNINPHVDDCNDASDPSHDGDSPAS